MKNMMRTSQDCYRCCLAEYLGIPYRKTPDFFSADNEKNHSAGEISEQIDEWLAKKKRLMRVRIETGIMGIADISPHGYLRAFAILRRCNRQSDHDVLVTYHAVLVTYHDGMVSGIEDPKPDSDYDYYSDLAFIEILVPLDRRNALRKLREDTNGERYASLKAGIFSKQSPVA